MKITMENSRLVTIIQLREFLDGTKPIEFHLEGRRAKYEFIKKTFAEFHFTTLPKKQKGIVRRYIKKVTGYSTSQITRVLVASFFGNPYRASYTRNTFPKKYTPSDITLLVRTDTLHGRLNGVATQKILYREYHEYHHEEYRVISSISVSHIYNIRKTRSYSRQTIIYTKTQSAKRTI